MKTNFTPEQLTRPQIKLVNPILRSCVHCGFCTATCPTYQVLGDELDSPRGRIYLIKDMLENDRPADEKTVTHIDRCLSCLACVTTCPSGVDYMHLIDTAREHIENTYRRPFFDRILRTILAKILPYPQRFRLALGAARLFKPLSPILPRKLRPFVDFAPKALPSLQVTNVALLDGSRPRKRVAILRGCVQSVLDPGISAAAVRLLTRHGCEVVEVNGIGCCGALTHHMGKTGESHKAALANIEAWSAEIADKGLDAIIITTSGCGTTVKDYGHIFRDHTSAQSAKVISSLAKDISEFAVELGIQPVAMPKLRVAYHAACSLQHGQQIRQAPKDLLKQVGFTVVEPLDSHLCCGSAGTYNLLQPEISGELRNRKVSSLEALAPQVIAAGNLGCIVQIASGTGIPIVHTVELLDWATGGPVPPKLAHLALEAPE